jgi:hypothetical protein
MAKRPVFLLMPNGGLNIPEEMLRSARVDWRSFDLEATRKQADETFMKDTKIRYELRKKLTTE